MKLLSKGRNSEVGKKTSPKKLNGQFYTPLPIAERMLELVGWPLAHPGSRLLDPACGDGVFLEAAIRKVCSLDLRKNENSRGITRFEDQPPRDAANLETGALSC